MKKYIYLTNKKIKINENEKTINLIEFNCIKK